MDKKKIWMRLGGWVAADESTIEAIRGGDKDALVRAVKENGFQPDGESYVPETETEFEIDPDEISLVTPDKK